MEYFKHKYAEDENMSRQIKIDGQGSDWYESAVFVVKDTVEKKQIPNNIVSYAEDLLERHMKVSTLGNTSKPCSYGWIDKCFWISIGLFVLMCIAYFCI